MHEFFERLKQRKLVQWALAYVAGAFALIQVLDIVAQRFGWPGYSVRFIIIALAVGFFVVLVLAWYHGERGAQRVTSTELLILSLLLAIGGAVVWHLAPTAPEQPGTTAQLAATKQPSAVSTPVNGKSIAVLPFENLSADKDNAYFADGIQDEILTGLAKIGDLKVISRTSTLRYDSKPPNLSEIGSALGVSNVLEGSVQRIGNRVRINVQLIGAASDNHLWAETYDRTLDDVFAVQSEVAQRIAGALKATLTGAEHAALERKPTVNAAAYEAYLRARAQIPRMSESNRDEFDRIIPALEEAVRLDPGFALAWAQLADLQVLYYFDGFDASAARLATAKAALQRAEALAPSLPEVQIERAVYMYYGERDFAGALAIAQAAREKLPNDARVWYVVAMLERRLGQWDATLADNERARVLSPNDFEITFDLATTLTLLHRFGDALPVIDALLTLRKDDPGTLEFKAFCLWNLEGVVGADRMLAGVNPDSPMGLALAAKQARFRGDALRAQDLLRKAIAASNASERLEFTFVGTVPARVDWQLQLAELLPQGNVEAETLYRNVADAAAGALAKAANPYVEASWDIASARVHAGHGERDKAAAEAQSAMALVPIERDAKEGPMFSADAARVYALIGDAARAVPLLRRLSERRAGLITPMLLKLDPIWNPIRDDPEFHKFIAEVDTGSSEH